MLLFGAGKGSCRASTAMEEQGAGVLPRSSAMAAGGSLLLPALERREWRWAEIRPEVEEGLGRHPWELASMEGACCREAGGRRGAVKRGAEVRPWESLLQPLATRRSREDVAQLEKGARSHGERWS